jgi:hypothetical protein
MSFFGVSFVSEECRIHSIREREWEIDYSEGSQRRPKHR